MSFPVTQTEAALGEVRRLVGAAAGQSIPHGHARLRSRARAGRWACWTRCRTRWRCEDINEQSTQVVIADHKPEVTRRAAGPAPGETGPGGGRRRRDRRRGHRAIEDLRELAHEI